MSLLDPDHAVQWTKQRHGHAEVSWMLGAGQILLKYFDYSSRLVFGVTANHRALSDRS